MYEDVSFVAMLHTEGEARSQELSGYLYKVYQHEKQRK